MKRFTLLLSLSLLTLTSGCDSSTTTSTAPKEANACAADLQNFCSTVEPGEGRLVACLKDHYAELSDECRKGMEQ